jgi:hypothetical protein
VLGHRKVALDTVQPVAKLCRRLLHGPGLDAGLFCSHALLGGVGFRPGLGDLCHLRLGQGAAVVGGRPLGQILDAGNLGAKTVDSFSQSDRLSLRCVGPLTLGNQRRLSVLCLVFASANCSRNPATASSSAATAPASKAPCVDLSASVSAMSADLSAYLSRRSCARSNQCTGIYTCICPVLFLRRCQWLRVASLTADGLSIRRSAASWS